MPADENRPPERVRAAFGAHEPAVRIESGRGRTWRVGDLVLKPLDMPPAAIRWLDADARARCDPQVLRLSLPVKSRSGELVVDGWTAFPVLTGTHESGRWQEIAQIARDFAALFESAERPSFIAPRTDPWARADRFAWNEEDLPGVLDAPHVSQLLEARRPLEAPSGIVHGDLAGNVLFDSSDPPAVIDLTLYWRPPEYSVAIIAADAVCFEGAPLSLLHSISRDPRFAQYLVRALLFRIATDRLTGEARKRFRSYDGAVSRALSAAAVTG